MHIDWFVFFAQLVNFLILIFLLRKFLYGRIIKAMDEREAGIAQRHTDADRMRDEAREAAEACEAKLRSLNERTEELMNQAKEAADARRQELMNKAREEIDEMKGRWVETINRAKTSFLEDLRRRVGTQIYAITRNVLMDLADTGLEERMVDIFIDRLKNLDVEVEKAIMRSVSESKGDIVIQSAFPLPDDVRKRIQQAVGPFMKNGIGIQYQLQPEMVLGIEMRAHGHKLAWSFNDYLVALEDNFSYALQEEAMGKR